MGAPNCKTYYSIASNAGRKKIFETPEDFATACDAYFNWCITNPIKSEEIHSSRLGVERMEVDKIRAFTALGLANFIGLSSTAFYEYGKREEFKDTFTHVLDIIRLQKFEHAAVGLLNPNFIGKDLGLVDKQENTIRGDINVEI